ncbi:MULTISPECIES: dihydrolipoamide acetyltransferase family protein [unclassified Arthrobacter]|uniref:dihydrolipoamide acetyltransferase family protein n=1 Tax=unclassified Arthrobacter TaxID=235627 RepID=UPI002106E5DD|nr:MULTISPECIES: dihydrolipoamide acetyltransferase family protein [unclassified Arthrobacter]MCQ1947980.1 2-oxo acid dehydrogenase subunit E2 [Arthrobacter sp. zg-Y1116]MCQ1987919.1 2-oxo acid dehydrogenase subunit E2 [Arthrobacter sp. zg-Y844]MCQ1996114.1 2-oxo acid dehydrogenase subunit E2 [Arthrobacter sp. zg-Y1171]UWX82821.1 2-oxo acid dehydrogenase subunit E2 [Arthrobacter sp. zg-Y1171]
MLREFRLPDLGEGLTESEILNWHVSVGDIVQLNQVIADVETAKAVVELPSPYAGTVAHLHEQAGTVVEVGSPIVSFEVAVPAGADAEAAGEPVQAKREPNLVGYGAVPDATGRPARRRRGAAPAPGPVSAAVPAPVAAAAPVPTPAPDPEQERPRSTPPVRKLARDMGVDLTQVQGSGPGGLVVRTDVVRAASPAAETEPTSVFDSAAAVPAPPVPEGREERIAISGMRKHTAAAMVASAFTAPHATVFLTVDVTPTMELLERLRQQPAFNGLKLSPLTMAAKAVCLGLKRFPSLNSRWDESAREIIRYNYVNLGIAAATPRGLMVPNIKDAQTMSLHGLAAAVTSLAQTAREGRTQPADLAGGTISISNVGVFGVDTGTPILNPGEAAILALGAVRRQPWEYNGAIALRSVMTLSLSFDHRLVDGEQGAGFLSEVGAVLAEPALALAMA